MRGLIRKILKEEFFQEDVRRTESLPDTTGLFVSKDSFGFELSLYDPISKNIYATITIVYRIDDAPFYFVSGVAAEKGFGPFIYELAMMILNKSGQALMPSRDGDVRGDAWGVWEKFYDRKDVEKKSLNLLDDDFRCDIIVGGECYFEENGDKEFWWSEMSKDEKHALIVFNTGYSMIPSSDFYKLTKNSDEYTKKEKDEAKNSASDLWDEKYFNENKNLTEARKIIKEIIKEELLGETHIGQKDLEKFANNILLYMGDVVVQARRRNEFLDEDSPELRSFPMFFTGSLSSGEYKEIKDFVESSDITIKPRELIEGSKKTQGMLSYGAPHLNKGLESFSIYLKYSQENLDEVNKMFDEKKYGEVKGRDVYLKLYYTFYSSLLHELQHAYDAWRSKGKSFNSQNNKQFIEKQKLASKVSKTKYEDLTPEEIKAISNGHKAYQNLTHEINARYAQSVQRVSIKTIDDNWNEIMNPLDKVFKSFKSEFDGWRNLSNKMKKRLTTRFAKAYQETSENLKTAEEIYGKKISDEISES